MQEETIYKEQPLDQLFLALSQAQGEMKCAKKDSENPYFHSSYADLASVWETAREPLAKYGLSVLQMFKEGNEGGLNIVTVLGHKSGQNIASTLTMPITKSDPQAIGSLITYGRRYSLMAILGIAPEDDDCEGGMDRSGDNKQNKPVNKSNNNNQLEGEEKTQAQLKEIGDWLMDMAGGDKEAAKDILKMVTANENFEGFNSIKALGTVKSKNPKQFYAIYNKLRQKYDEYLTSYDAGQEFNPTQTEEVQGEIF